jgi:hypothetical protein
MAPNDDLLYVSTILSHARLPNLSDSRASHHVAEELIPSALYKYRAIPPKESRELGYLERLFTHHEVYFSSPSEFNDPFDCRINASFEGSDEEWLLCYEEVLVSQSPNLTGAARRQAALRCVADGRHSNPVHQRALQEELQRTAAEFGIFCASTQSHSLAMWARYADGHRGICLEFRHVTNLFAPPDAMAAMRLSYASSLQKISILGGDDEEIFRCAFLTKSREWRDECEYRYLIPSCEPRIRHYDPAALTGIIFGCRTPHSDRDLIVDWVRRGRLEPTFYEAVIRDGEYALEIRRAQNHSR